MGVKSTYTVRREIAQQVLLSNIFKLSNDQLAEALEALPQSTYRNYNVTDTVEEDDMRMIDTVEQFEYK